MSEPIEDYDEDERIVCKYGSACYQKNQAHRNQYKHPSASTTKEKPETRVKKSPLKTGRLMQSKLDFFVSKSKRKIDQVMAEDSHEQDDTAHRRDDNSEENESNDVKKLASEVSSPEKTVKNETGKAISEKIEAEGSEKTTISEEDVEEVTEGVSEEDGEIIIKKLFLVEMPRDFYSFWEFCTTLSSRNPKDALSSIDLTLVGPFDVLAGTLKEDSVSPSQAVLHWRYYYDPPEFQTILKSDKDMFHLGYFRDDPNLPPVFVAYNSAKRNSLITHVAENIFGAVDWYISQSEKSCDPFKKKKLSNLKTSLQKWAKEHDFTLEKYTKSMQDRNKSVASKTFHQAGIVVPYDKNTKVGYRPLSENPNNLKKLLKKIEDSTTAEERTAHLNSLHTVVNWANIAMDECDFGTNLELGLDLFSYGTDHFNSIIRSSLRNAYNFLGRREFATIIEAHLDKRKRGADLDILLKK
ncbi:histone PARylation factor 1 isoform X2 [Planococcus citri]|uniref:histone PARylation factor 1 isoform X2 n=1 Tax=Planococcus citri TaxID=170843 RepID=UPI0031F8C6C7